MLQSLLSLLGLARFEGLCAGHGDRGFEIPIGNRKRSPETAGCRDGGILPPKSLELATWDRSRNHSRRDGSELERFEAPSKAGSWVSRKVAEYFGRHRQLIARGWEALRLP